MKVKKLLIVDDEADFLETAAQRLSFEGFDVVEALDGDTALAILAKSDPPDMVLLDIMMPRLNGIEVFKKMRSDPRTSKTPVIFLTVWDDLVEDTSIRSDPYCTTLFKPFEFDALVKLMQEIFEGRWPSKG